MFCNPAPQHCHQPPACYSAPVAGKASLDHYAEIHKRMEKSAWGETWPLMRKIGDQFRALDRLRDDCNFDGAETPNPFAMRQARSIVDLLAEKQLAPTAIMPSVEGGIGITIVRSGRRGSIEVLNSEEMVAATYESVGDPDVWEFTSDMHSIAETVRKINAYLSA